MATIQIRFVLDDDSAVEYAVTVPQEALRRLQEHAHAEYPGDGMDDAATCVRRLCRQTVRGWWLNVNASETERTVKSRGTFPEPLPADDLAGSEPVRRA